MGAPALSKNSVALSASSAISKNTGTLATGLPNSPMTVAMTWVEFESVMRVGTARRRMATTRALPTLISGARSALTEPENARICATPERLSATKRAVATPRRVRVSASMLPRSVVHRTTVPSVT